MGKKRIFIALALSENLQEEILKWEKNYQKFAGLPAGRQVRWLSPKNLHITFVPPWYEEDAAELYPRLKNVKSPAFDILFERVQFGPDSRRPRLIWAEGKAPGALLGLQKDLEKASGRKSERRPWKMHLTLARFRPEDFSKFVVKKLDEKVAWKEKVESFVVMESRLSPEGAEYEILEKYDLRN